MELEALSADTKKALEALDSSPFFKETGSYLAGGTAAALQMGHRFSFDLDFFTKKKFQEEVIAGLLEDIGSFKLGETGWQTLIGEFEKTKFSLFYYKYKLISPPKKFLKNVSVASLKDIAAMKVAAIADRGTKRDFIDLYFISSKLPLTEILTFYDEKYKKLAVNKVHILRSLTYFDDAEIDPMPQMIKEVVWDEVKRFLQDEVKKLVKKSGLI